jgi:hypothetical protein
MIVFAIRPCIPHESARFLILAICKDVIFSVLFSIAPLQTFTFSGENTPTDHAPTSKGWQNHPVIAAISGLIPKTKLQETICIEQQASSRTPKVRTPGGVVADRDIQGNTITITGSHRETATRVKPEGS